MSAIPRTRILHNNQIVLDQADFFESDGYTRVVGLTTAELLLQVFYQNEAQPWPLVSGDDLPDTQVVSGKVYWSEIPGTPGCYNVRFRPHASGFWRVLITYPAGYQIIGQEYDINKTASETTSGGLKPSFTKPNC